MALPLSTAVARYAADLHGLAFCLVQVFPLLEFLGARELYDAADIEKAKLQVGEGSLLACSRLFCVGAGRSLLACFWVAAGATCARIGSCSS